MCSGVESAVLMEKYHFWSEYSEVTWIELKRGRFVALGDVIGDEL